jgi:hypothetical protein
MTYWCLLEARLLLGLIFLSASVERNAVFGEALYVYIPYHPYTKSHLEA